MDATSTILLSRDELTVFLDLLGLSAMNGLPPDDIQLSERERAIRYNIGEFSLQARGLLESAENGQIILDDKLVAIAGSAAFPRATVLISHISPAGDNTYHFFSRGPELLVEHTIVRPGIFKFSHWCDYAALVQRVGELTKSLQEFVRQPMAVTHPVAKETAEYFLRCTANGEVQTATAALAKNGFPAPAAASLAVSLQHYPYWVAVAGWGFQDQEVAASETVALFSGPDSCWVLENTPQHAPLLQISAACGASCQQRMIDLLQVLK